MKTDPRIEALVKFAQAAGRPPPPEDKFIKDLLDGFDELERQRQLSDEEASTEDKEDESEV